MALLNKTGITNGSTITAEHITRTIDALTGVSSDTITATGTLIGTASFATTASHALSGGLTISGAADTYMVAVDGANLIAYSSLTFTGSSLSATTKTIDFSGVGHHGAGLILPDTIPGGTPFAGSTYFNAAENNLYIYNGTTWVRVNLA